MIATAIGLLAAIPATIFYNVFVAQLREIQGSLSLFGEELVEDAVFALNERTPGEG